MALLMIDPVALAAQLVRCPSITPADAGALDVLETALRAIGFTTYRLRFGAAPDGPVENLFARLGTAAPHFAFAGHTDVVPPGDLAAWSIDPFAGCIADGRLVGRGANDMKGALAAMVAAAQRHAARGAPGSLSFIITGDEEGPATFGTDPLLGWMAANGHTPDHCLVGEPTSARLLGDTVKIGRRGSLNAWITVNGAQGHVAYPDRADNPIARLVRIAAALQARVLDAGNAWFDASNLEITDLAVGNPTTNLIPARATLRLNIRFNSEHCGTDLERWIRQTVAHDAPSAEIVVKISGEAFITHPSPFTTLVADAVAATTGRVPALSTTCGTSDARFIRRLCPVVEFGLPGASMHKVDESAATADIVALADVYDAIVQRYFA
jgi:succinyl-diaminopimelate desuccinylase